MPILQLSHQEYNALWRRLQLGDKHLMLYTRDHGSTLTERNELDEQAWCRLQGRGLVDGAHVAPYVEDMLGALSRPTLEVDLRIRTGRHAEQQMLACAAGLVGAVATLTPDGLSVEPASPSGLATALLARLPQHPPAAVNPVTVPAALADRPGGLTAEAGVTTLERAGLRPTEARQLAALLGGGMARRAVIGAAARNRIGRRHRVPEVITVLDTDAGRSLVRRRRTREGTEVLLIGPGSRERLTSEVEALVRSATGAVAHSR